MKTLLILAFTLLVTACAADPAGSFTWEDGLPDEQYQYARLYQVGGEWTDRTLTNDKRIACVLDEPWRDPVTAVRLEKRETGQVVKTLDCSDS